MSTSPLYTIEDLRNLSAYPFGDASRYLKLPATTLNHWSRGRFYMRGGKRVGSPPLLILPGAAATLSFINLVEAHALLAFRKEHGVSMHKLKRAAEYLRRKKNTDHPFSMDLMTDGVHVLLEDAGLLENASQEGQLAMKVVLEKVLKRVVYGPDGVAKRLFLLTHGIRDLDAPKRIVVDPMISFGRPVVAKAGVPTAVIEQRFSAGDSIRFLARDYDVDTEDIEEAIRCEREAETEAEAA